MTYNYNEWLKNPIKIFCKCGCNEEIIIKPRYRYYNIPEYIHGHGKQINITSDSYKKWLKDGKPKIYCNCGCKREIIIERRRHKRCGISKYIRGHNKSMLGKKTTEETKIKQSNARYNKYYAENNPFFGKHHTEETRQKNREAHLGKSTWNKGLTKKTDERIKKYVKNRIIQKPGVHSGRGKGCYYNSPLQGKIWLRSTYELAYAKYLDEYKILWMYEMETFDLKDYKYIPDFFLPQFEKFIEIKGYMSKLAQEKINKFLEQYPWDLEILYKEDLIKLGCKL